MNEPRRWLDDTETPPGLKQVLGVELESRQLPAAVRQRVGVRLLGLVGVSAAGVGAASKAAAAVVSAPGGTGASIGVASGAATSGSGAVASGTAAASTTVSGVAGGSVGGTAAVAGGAKAATVAGVVTKGALVAGGTGSATSGLLGVGATGSLVVNGIISAAIGTAAVVGVTQVDLGVDRASDPAAISAPLPAQSSATSLVHTTSGHAIPGRSSADDSLSVPSAEALRTIEEVAAEGEVEAPVAQLAPNRATSEPAPERRVPSTLSALNAPGTTPRLQAQTPQLSNTPEQAPDSLSRQVKALREISAIVDTEPTRALQLVARHASDYPRSQLASERRLLEVRALLRVGRRADAERLGQRLLENSTAGLYHSRVKQLLGRNVSSGAE